MATYTPIGSEYRIVSRCDTHLIIECPVDKKLLMKRMMGSIIAVLIILGAYIVIMFVIIGPIMMSATPVLIILPFFFMLIIGVIPGAMYGSLSRFAKFPFTVELDKVSGKLQMCTPNPFLVPGMGYYTRHSVYASIGQYLTNAWDLDKVVFRACMAGEYEGPGGALLRMAFKNKFVVLVSPMPWSYPIVFFASERPELGQSLMGEIDRFLRTGPLPAEAFRGSTGEQPYHGSGY